MKIYSYNLNGIRSAINKGFLSWVEEVRPDVLCLQELKAQEEQIDKQSFEKLGYKVVKRFNRDLDGISLAVIQMEKELETD